MEIKEIRIRKKKLEMTMTTLLYDFKVTTGLKIWYIGVRGGEVKAFVELPTE
ncbi:MAG: hypothetical protein NG712_02880 [Omnitrophica bacterium]|nr:hypothetical protein [Candidatus Omnitrophota bacterium]